MSGCSVSTPPLPPALTNLALVWDGSPVNFTQSVSYVCREEGLYFERDRDMTSYNITCLPGGQWDEPSKWPKCIKCKSQQLYTISNSFHIFIVIQLSTALLPRPDHPQALGSGMVTMGMGPRLTTRVASMGSSRVVRVTSTRS